VKVLVVNPVGHTTWDRSDLEIYRSYANPGTEVVVKSLPRGSYTVETLESYFEAEKETVNFVLKNYKGFEGIIINCFLEPGVHTLRKKLDTRMIVVGPAEASLSIASLYGDVAVVTVEASADSLELIREKVKALGFEKKVVSIVGIPLSVKDLDVNKQYVVELLIKESKKALLSGADVIVLGCTGFAGLAKSVERELDVPVIDPAWASIKLLEVALSR